LLNKFYVDELYDLTVVRPFRWIGQAIFVAVDRFIIDLLIVDGSAFVVDIVGRIARWFQNGQVQRYLVALLVGGALVVAFATRRTLDFTWQPEGPLAARFHAEIGDGPAAAGAEVEWDFDGDGRTDSTDVDPIRAFSNPGKYPVTLRVKSGPFSREQEVTHEVAVGPGTARSGGGSN
jgi:hypothetical protein